jgi:hypothetical protein
MVTDSLATARELKILVPFDSIAPHPPTTMSFTGD